jgi:3-oxoacyl-[acyl-carrier protein] reductase
MIILIISSYKTMEIIMIPNDFDLSGKNAIILASSKGLGKSVAEQYAKAGANVALCARNRDDLEKTAKEISDKYNVKTFHMVTDISNPSQLKAFIENAGKEFGLINLLFTNSGGPPAGPFLDFGDDEWTAAFQLNLLSAARSIRAVIPFMKNAPGAAITCNVSYSTKEPIPFMVLSNAMRPAVVGLVKTLSMELAEFGIRVNAIAPGRISTQRLTSLDKITAEKKGVTPESVREGHEKTIPLGRYGNPSEFGKAALFLATNAASYITGQTVFVDGGITKSLL